MGFSYPHLIVLYNPQPRVGKTSLAVNLSAAISHYNLRVATLDMDCYFHSFTNFILNFRGSHTLSDFFGAPHFLFPERYDEAKLADNFSRFLLSQFSEFDVVVVDTGSGQSNLHSIALRFAATVLTPLPKSGFALGQADTQNILSKIHRHLQQFKSAPNITRNWHVISEQSVSSTALPKAEITIHEKIPQFDFLNKLFSQNKICFEPELKTNAFAAQWKQFLFQIVGEIQICKRDIQDGTPNNHIKLAV